MTTPTDSREKPQEMKPQPLSLIMYLPRKQSFTFFLDIECGIFSECCALNDKANIAMKKIPDDVIIKVKKVNKEDR